MKIEQRRWTKASGWSPSAPGASGAQLILACGSVDALQNVSLLGELRAAHPGGKIIGCTTAGEISGTEVLDEALVVTAVTLDATRLHGARVRLSEHGGSVAAGEVLARALPAELPGLAGGPPDPLVHVFVLSDGLRVNGSELANGITRHLPSGVTVTGGLAGDGERFGTTLILWNEQAEAGTITAIGFYSRTLKVGYGSMGGWDPFGPERLVTRSEGNVLHALDGRSALDLYKKYLGEHSQALPASGLLFPLSLRHGPAGARPVVRTLLNVDEQRGTMTFAGDVPEGSYVRLMKASFERLIEGATEAARTASGSMNSVPAELAILISCVGRKLVLKQRIEEELEGVRDVLGGQATLAGFYSYGEISPFMRGGRCQLHNQTMTITTLAEP